MSNQPPSRAKNMAYAVVAGQSGCWTLLIIMIALFGGLALDAVFGLKGPFTIGLLLLSIPFSLFIMVRLALSAVKQIVPTQTNNLRKSSESHAEEDDL
ncbi:MAG: hypothetical protein J0M07_30235 [Anaerolineae bacterium]|jgi:hypothetical protein|nr:hypothetical protein [Anaerolineae bacterium]